MIPKSIVRQHVLRAIDEIRQSSISENPKSTKYDLIWEDAKLPPKLVISVASKYSTGKELDHKHLSGDNEANDFLKSLGFEIKERRNDWSWSDCYFAVWAYDQLDVDREQIKNVLYREVAALIGRSAKSVEFKIQNVSYFDRRPRDEKPVAEAAHAQGLLGEVFRWYWEDRDKARQLYWQLREEFELDISSELERNAESSKRFVEIIIEEGAIANAPSTRRKRSQKLLQAGRAHFKSLDPAGMLRCEACGFVTPDGVLTELIQLHHSEPVYEADRNGRAISLERAIRNLIPLCPTCHSLAHTVKPPLDVVQIKEVLSRGSDSSSTSSEY